MIGERERLLLSAYFDGTADDAERADAERLLADSEEARAYLDLLASIRSSVRAESVSPPDLTPRIMAAIAPARRRERGRRLVAAFVAGAVAGAVFIGLAVRQPAPVAAADLPEEVLAAQSRVESLRADLRIVERGWHPDVPERTYRGTLAYTAPETLWIVLEDLTAYPSSEWRPNHVEMVVDRDRAWTSAVPGCPGEAQPDCAPDAQVTATVDREPFPDRSPAPLDLIVPVAGFIRSGPPRLLGESTIDGIAAVGVEVTAAQVASLLEGLTGSGNFRDIHPTDRVELWLDRDALIPLSLAVYPSDSPDRELWAVRHGFTDYPGSALLRVEWEVTALNGDADLEPPPPPAGASVVSAGFTDSSPPDVEAMTSSRLPSGMTLHRAGAVATKAGPNVFVASWSDGRAWVKVAWTRQWEGARLFGDLGDLVRRVDLGDGVAYLNERADRIAIHTDDLDVLVTGSLPAEGLLEVAAGLAVEGVEVPDDWAEAASVTLGEAKAALPGLLVPAPLTGFAPPAIRVEPDSVVLAYAGPGNRGFLLTETTTALSPPLEADVRGVVVRDRAGRYSPERGLLEWVEGDLTIGLASTTLSLDELLEIAETMVTW